MDRDALIAAAHKTVETFAQLTGRQLRLRNAHTPRTNGLFIAAPFRHPSFYCLVEHELAHVLFLSDARAKAVLGEQARALAVAAGQGEYADHFSALGEKLFNLVEDERVNSLWGELYPGSLADLQALAKRTMLRHRKHAHSDVVTFVLCVAARVPKLPDGPYSPLRSAVERALQQVQLAGQEASLLAARDLLIEILHHPSPDGITRGGKETTPEQRLDDLEAPARPPAGLDEETQRALDAAAEVAPGDETALKAALDASRETARERLDHLRDQLQQTAPRSESARLLRSVKNRVLLKDVPPGELPRVKPLAPEDAAIAAKVAQLARRIRGRKVRRLEESGFEVDVEAAVQARASGAVGPLFRAQVSGRGFRALLVVDRSSSMAGKPSAEVERAATILRRALVQPGVALETWGFRSHRLSAVLERVPEGFDLQTCPALPVEGQTPLHVAVAAAADRLRDSREQGHLFILTDGEPCFAQGKERVSLQPLQGQVRDEVRRARRHGIHVHCLVVGDVLSEEDALRMFGPRRHWMRVGHQNVGAALLRLVGRSLLC